MARELLPDALWAEIEPLLRREPPKPNGGRPRLLDRAALTGILFVLSSGIPWEMLPQETSSYRRADAGGAIVNAIGRGIAPPGLLASLDPARRSSRLTRSCRSASRVVIAARRS
jgi:transposase